jgi:hypothetical protein
VWAFLSVIRRLLRTQLLLFALTLEFALRNTGGVLLTREKGFLLVKELQGLTFGFDVVIVADDNNILRASISKSLRTLGSGRGFEGSWSTSRWPSTCSSGRGRGNIFVVAVVEGTVDSSLDGLDQGWDLGTAAAIRFGHGSLTSNYCGGERGIG